MPAFWWLAGTITASGLILVMPGGGYFVLFGLLGLVCLAGEWSLVLSLGNCSEGCSPGLQMGMALMGLPAALGTLIFALAALFKMYTLYRRR